MVNIFETFLPQLLRYPNPADPLNGEAANLLLRDPAAYNKRVQEYVAKYASNVTSTSRAFDDMKEPCLGARKDSGATTLASRPSLTPDTAAMEVCEEEGYMSDASELSDL